MNAFLLNIHTVNFYIETHSNLRAVLHSPQSSTSGRWAASLEHIQQQLRIFLEGTSLVGLERKERAHLQLAWSMQTPKPPLRPLFNIRMDLPLVQTLYRVDRFIYCLILTDSKGFHLAFSYIISNISLWCSTTSLVRNYFYSAIKVAPIDFINPQIKYSSIFCCLHCSFPIMFSPLYLQWIIQNVLYQYDLAAVHIGSASFLYMLEMFDSYLTPAGPNAHDIWCTQTHNQTNRQK